MKNIRFYTIAVLFVIYLRPKSIVVYMQIFEIRHLISEVT